MSSSTSSESTLNVKSRRGAFTFDFLLTRLVLSRFYCVRLSSPLAMSPPSCRFTRSGDGKKEGDYGHMTHNSAAPGQSSPRPVVIPRINSASHHNSNVGFIGPQLPPHMTKVLPNPKRDGHDPRFSPSRYY